MGSKVTTKDKVLRRNKKAQSQQAENTQNAGVVLPQQPAKINETIPQPTGVPKVEFTDPNAIPIKSDEELAKLDDVIKEDTPQDTTTPEIIEKAKRLDKKMFADAMIAQGRGAELINHVGENPNVNKDTEEASSETTETKESDEQPEQEEEKKSYTYQELYEQLYGAPPTKEEIKAENERERKRKMWYSIGDGISSLSNLFFTTQYAPNAYDPEKSMSKANQERYNRILKERKDYADGFLKAYERDLANEKYDKEWKEKLRQRAEDQAYKKERDKVADKRWEQEQENQKEYRKEMLRIRDDYNKGRIGLGEVKAAQTKFYQNARLAAQTYRQASGGRYDNKKTPFTDGKGTTIIINDNTWKGNYQMIVDALQEDGIVPYIPAAYMNEKDIENFIKSNWRNSPSAIETMKYLENVDATGDYNNNNGNQPSSQPTPTPKKQQKKTETKPAVKVYDPSKGRNQ